MSEAAPQSDQRPAEADGGKWLISDAGGLSPKWRADGKELYYNDPGVRVLAVETSPGSPGFHAGLPKVLFIGPAGTLEGAWDVTQDGERFLIAAPSSQSVQAPFTVVLNWPALLNR
jgi:hypothetical protein